MIPVSLLPNCNSVVKCRQKDRIPQVVSKLPAISALPGLSLSYDAILTCRINVTARRYKNIDGESPLIPRIEEVGSARPYWSVMIPTYNPRADCFEETLNKVLQQDSDRDRCRSRWSTTARSIIPSDRSDEAVMFDIGIWLRCM